MSSVDHLLTIPAQLVGRSRAGTPDRLNNLPWVEAAPIDIALWLWPASAEEQVARDAGTVTHMAIIDAAVVIDTFAYLLIGGVRYDLAAPPMPWVHPHEGADFQQLELIQGASTDLEVGS